MKKCPFCAEEIQPEAIKCRFCNSFLDGTAAGDAAGKAHAAGGGATAVRPPAASPIDMLRPQGRDAGERKVIYAGSPSWRAFFGQYFVVTLAAIAAVAGAVWFTQRPPKATTSTTLLAVGIPLGLSVIAYVFLMVYRRSVIFRVTTSNIESERGVLSKRIDVLELWRCRDVRYVQSLLDRILGVAHIEITTTDVTTPQLTLVGLPASRQLFEKIRDSIEIQRQSHNVVGMVH